MSAYRLLAKAEADYRDIGRYTQRSWGVEQRRAYLKGLMTAFQRLAENPELGRARHAGPRSGVLRHRGGAGSA